MAQPYYILNLELPDPQEAGLDVEQQQLAYSMRPALDQLGVRDMSECPKSITNLDTAFSEFASLEAKSWEESGYLQPNPKLLVRPSGSLQSRIIHHLHQPSTSSMKLEDGEVADPSNACVSMITNNGFIHGRTLIYDHLHRRHQTSDGLEDYPQAVLHAHEAFTQRIEDSSEAKIEVVYGAKVQKRLLYRPDARYSILPLWGDFEGILLFLAYESNYGNADFRYTFRRAVFFAAHPQRLFYTTRGAPVAIRQDRLITAAIRMTGEHINIVEDYHQNRRFSTFTSRSSVLADTVLRGSLSSQSNHRLQDLECAAKCSTMNLIEDAGWLDLFNPKPHSYHTMLQLLPKALQSFEVNEKDWKLSFDFPEPVLQWFQGKWYILFHDCKSLGAKEIVSVCQRLCPSSLSQSGSPSLRQTVYNIIKTQHEFPTPSDRHLRNHSDLWYIRYRLQDIETCCAVCRETCRVDDFPKWCVNRPDLYCARYLTCVSNQCDRKSRKMRPIDTTINWINGEPKALQVKENASITWQRCIRPTEDNQGSMPTVIVSWCIKCQENTRLSGGRTFFEDNPPRWTLGKASALRIA